jgi:hypothetical protein
VGNPPSGPLTPSPNGSVLSWPHCHLCHDQGQPSSDQTCYGGRAFAIWALPRESPKGSVCCHGHNCIHHDELSQHSSQLVLLWGCLGGCVSGSVSVGEWEVEAGPHDRGPARERWGISLQWATDTLPRDSLCFVMVIRRMGVGPSRQGPCPGE